MIMDCDTHRLVPRTGRLFMAARMTQLQFNCDTEMPGHSVQSQVMKRQSFELQLEEVSLRRYVRDSSSYHLEAQSLSDSGKHMHNAEA